MDDRTPALTVDVSWNGCVATVTVTGELDFIAAPELTTRLLEVADGRPERLVVDLDGLVLVDAAGARALDRVHKVLETQRPIILRRPHPSARKVLGLTRLADD